MTAAPTIAISDDGRRAAFADPIVRDSVRIWDVPRKRAIVTFAAGVAWRQGFDPLTFAAGFSPDASLIALHGTVDAMPALVVYAVDTGNLVGTAPYAPGSSAWSPDGRWIVSYCSNARERDVEPGGVLKTVQGNVTAGLLFSEVIYPVPCVRTWESMQRLEFSPDGTTLSANRTLLQTHKDERGCGLMLPRDEGGGVIRYAGNDQRWRIEAFPEDADTKILRLDQMTPKRRRIELKHPGFTAPPFARNDKPAVARPSRYALSPNGKQLVVASYVDHFRTGLLDAFKDPDPKPTEFALESWDVEKQERTAIWNSQNSREKFLAVEFCRGGEWVLTASDDGIKVWDAQTGKVLRRFPMPVPVYLQKSFSQRADRGKLHVMVCADAGILPFVVSPDGEHALIVNAENAWRYDAIALADGARRGSVHVAAAGLKPAIALSPQGRWAAVAHHHRVFLHDLTSGRMLDWDGARMPQRVTALAFNHAGDVLATGDETGMVRLWDLGWIGREAERLGIPLPVLSQ